MLKPESPKPQKPLTPGTIELSFGSFESPSETAIQIQPVLQSAALPAPPPTRPGSSHPARVLSAQQRPSSAHPPAAQPRPSSAHPSSKSSRVQSGHPSEQLQALLSKLGTLNDRHENLRAVVEELQVDQPMGLIIIWPFFNQKHLHSEGNVRQT